MKLSKNYLQFKKETLTMKGELERGLMMKIQTENRYFLKIGGMVLIPSPPLFMDFNMVKRYNGGAP